MSPFLWAPDLASLPSSCTLGVALYRGGGVSAEAQAPGLVGLGSAVLSGVRHVHVTQGGEGAGEDGAQGCSPVSERHQVSGPGRWVEEPFFMLVAVNFVTFCESFDGRGLGEPETLLGPPDGCPTAVWKGSSETTLWSRELRE